MKLLLDSQISAQTAGCLRKAGHDVREVRNDPLLRSASDEVLVQTAWREGRVLVSALSVFAQLVSRDSSWRPGVILLLAGDPRPRSQQKTLQSLLRQVPEAKLMTSLTIIEGHRARIYPLVANPPQQVTAELQPRPAEPLPSRASPAFARPSLACPVFGYTLHPLHGCKQVCPACGYLSSCSMD